MTDYFVLGMNHKTAPVEIREMVAYSPDALEQTCGEILALPSVEEIIVLSTCNRTELISVVNDTEKAEEELQEYLLNDRGMKDYEKSWFFFYRSSGDAVRHIFRVAAGLDSMVVGELQITGQLKTAWEYAKEAGACGKSLEALLQHALKTVKVIRNSTNVSEGFVSVGSTAAELARKILGDLRKREALLIGAGEISEVTAKHLMKKGLDSLKVINRTFKNGKKLAEKLGGEAFEFSKLNEILETMDIVISSTGSREFILKTEDVKEIMRRRHHRPVFFIDIAVPRDIEPGIADLPDVYLYDIDDLDEAVQANLELRKSEAQKAEKIVEEEAEKFSQKMRMRNLNPLIASIQENASVIREKEIEKFIRKSGIKDENLKKEIDILTSSIIKKVLQEPIVTVRKLSLDESKGPNYINFIKDLFNLE